MKTNEQPEFDSLDEFLEHERGLIPERAAEVVKRAVAEFRADGFDVSAAVEEQLAQRVRKMLSDRLDQMATSLGLEAQLKGTS